MSCALISNGGDAAPGSAHHRLIVAWSITGERQLLLTHVACNGAVEEQRQHKVEVVVLDVLRCRISCV
jgi:hypothetical protein